MIVRTVVAVPGGESSPLHRKINRESRPSSEEWGSHSSDRPGGTMIDLFPLLLRIHFCDVNGEEILPDQEALTIRKQSTSRRDEVDSSSSNDEEILLCSKWKTVIEVINNLCGASNEGKENAGLSRRQRQSKRRLTGLDPAMVRLWMKVVPLSQEAGSPRSSPRIEFRLLEGDLMLKDANIIDGQILVAEVARADGSWPRDDLMKQQEQNRALQQLQQNSIVTPAVAAHSTSDGTVVSTRPLRGNKGLVGLDNLGNTCYMNSSLQALLHTDLLMDYFLSSSYLRDINTVNVHGYKGLVARSFGKLANELWSSPRSCISPKGFYRELASVREQFAGNEQHDVSYYLIDHDTFEL